MINHPNTSIVNDRLAAGAEIAEGQMYYLDGNGLAHPVTGREAAPVRAVASITAARAAGDTHVKGRLGALLLRVDVALTGEHVGGVVYASGPATAALEGTAAIGPIVEVVTAREYRVIAAVRAGGLLRRRGTVARLAPEEAAAGLQTGALRLAEGQPAGLAYVDVGAAAAAGSATGSGAGGPAIDAAARQAAQQAEAKAGNAETKATQAEAKATKAGEEAARADQKATKLRQDIESGALGISASDTQARAQAAAAIGALGVANYAALGALATDAPSAVVTDPNQAGTFVRVPAAGHTADGTLKIAGQGGMIWVRQYEGPQYVEWFGAAADADAATNTEAIKRAISQLKPQQVLAQKSDWLKSHRVEVSAANARYALHLRLRAARDEAGALLQIWNVADGYFDVSIDGADFDVNGLDLRKCARATIPTSAQLNSFVSKGVKLQYAIFLRDCVDFYCAPLIKKVVGVGSHAVRGIMISDNELRRNGGTVIGNVEEVYRTGGTLNDADGIYIESPAGHTGGLRIINGRYINCEKRFIKSHMPNVYIAGNTGRNALSTTEMYAMISSYQPFVGHIVDNDMECTGEARALYGVDIGGAQPTDRVVAVVRNNRLHSANVVSASALAYKLTGELENVQMDLGDCAGFAGVLTHASTASAATGQKLQINGGSLDNKGGLQTNGISLYGKFDQCDIDNIRVKQPVAGRFLLSAPQMDEGVLNLRNVHHQYAWGELAGGIRAQNLSSNRTRAGSFDRYENGVRIRTNNALPPEGQEANYKVGDIVEAATPTPGQPLRRVKTAAGWKTVATVEV